MNHYLSIILFTPLAGALLLLFVSKQNENAIRWIANIVALIGFAISIPLWFWYNPQSPDFQFVERAQWIPSIGAEYFLGVDGFSTLLILLTTMMGSIAILSSWSAITERVKEFYIFLLVLQTGMLGAFMALDFLLFFLFWEVMLVPMYFLIGIWGSANRLYSAIKFFLYTLVGSVVMLLGILAIYFYNYNVTGVYTFDVTRYQALNLPFNLQWWVFLAFFLGFAIKVPMFPFHTWLPDAHTDAPTAGSVILAAVLLKMGTYGFIRFSLPILPEATRAFVPMMVVLSIIGIVYGALVALAQKDWKRLVAYSSVSHMGLVMLGMFALNPVGITGSIFQQLNHGISTGALFLLVGVVYERRHTREISEYGGLSKVMPVYAAVFLVMTMSSIGLPTLNGFIGEFLILQGVFVASKVWAAFAASGIVLGAAYMLYLYQRTMFGKVDNPKNETLMDLSGREFATFAPLIVLAVWMGLYPKPFLDRLNTSVARVIARVSPQYNQAMADCGLSPAATLAGGSDGGGEPRGRQQRCAVPRVARRAGRTGSPSRRPRPECPANAPGHRPQRLLLHPAGDRAHGGRADRPHRRRVAAARQQVARLGHDGGAGGDLCVAGAFPRHASHGVERPHRRRPVRALFQGGVPCRREHDRADVGALSRGGGREPRRVLLPDPLLDARHDDHGGRHRSHHELHRARDHGRVVLHPGRLHQAEPAFERGGGEILPARRVLARHSAVRHVAAVRAVRVPRTCASWRPCSRASRAIPCSFLRSSWSSPAWGSRLPPCRSICGRPTCTRGRRRP